MSGSILDVMNERIWFPHLFKDYLNNLHVCLFVVAAHVIDVAINAMTNNEIDCLTMIRNVEPISNV